ncbi:hypothetical protein QR680_017064 [Steinernema hermaphroditum]|uniref:Uncharacterized protein n=1 Tax=Steinernema hermaphroditum TaxID=289476 RepID=A0AA39HFL3_9BILA|nr:hypothetical protein QR680_017064 [Steinernema hermaphroditum]
MSLPPHNFNPNDRKFRSCCCHVKTFTIIFGVLEIFAICFLLVAVLPDVNTKVCSEMALPNATNAASRGETDIFITVKQLSCDMNIAWLIWAVCQIFALNVMFYVMALIEAIVLLQAEDNENSGLYLAAVVVGSTAVLVVWTYIFICEFRCCQFIKRSFETGFSISNTRPIGPSTISLSEHNRPHTAQASSGGVPRSLPPLKHTYTIGRPPMYLAAQEKNDN